MKILLDTHAFLWWDSSPEKLGKTVTELLSQTENAVYVSVVSAWEIQIKNWENCLLRSRLLN